MITGTVETPDNPFPGLRPFQAEESHLFFGREGLSEELLSRLCETRFLAVVGTSGSGKSSLVRAGLLPALQGGLMAEAGSDWRIAVLRPGNGPIGELARVLNDPRVLGRTIDENEEAQRIIIESTLRRGSLGLVEIVRQAELAQKEENLLIVVDQFEELFRYSYDSSKPQFVKRAPFSASGSKPLNQPAASNNGKSPQPPEAEKYENEAAAFVNLLLEATRQKKIPIFVVITMRSDYLGDCAQFWGLPEAINEGQYLVPRLTRDQQRKAITGPVAVNEAEIKPRLVNQLLNDMGDDPDQLPLLQHALMRTWENAAMDSNGRKSLDSGHYITVGGMADALSKHLEHAYGELSDTQKKIAEKLFKCLTVETPGGQKIRRPTVLKEICEIIDEKEDDVIDVIEVFRQPGRSFLMPPVSEHLKSESQIDISHESLIRCWQRLRSWVDEEAKSASDYQRLADTAILYKVKRAELLRGPEAHFALRWYEENKPNEAWAKRYHEANFNLVKDFLEKSRKQRRKEVRRKVIAILAAPLSVALVVVIYLAILAIHQRDKAMHTSYAAFMNLAQDAYDLGRYGEASRKLDQIFTDYNEDKWLGFESYFLNKDKLLGFEWYYLWTSSHNEMGVLRDEDSKPTRDFPITNLLAKFSPDRSKVISAGMGKVKLWNANTRKVESSIPVSFGITSMAVSKDGKIAVGGDNGSTSLCNFDTKECQPLKEQSPPEDKNLPVNSVAFSLDGKFLAAVVGYKLKLWDVENRAPLPPFPDAQSKLLAVAFSSDKETLAVGGEHESISLCHRSTNKCQPLVDTTVVNKQAADGASTTKQPSPPFNSVAFSPDGKFLAIGSGDGTIKLWNGSKFKSLRAHARDVTSVAFYDNWLATGSQDGSVTLRDVNLEFEKIEQQENANPDDQPKPTILNGHSDFILSMDFSSDGNTLVTGSADGTARLWDVSKKYQQSPRTDPPRAVLSLAFSSDGKTLASGRLDGTLELVNVDGLLREIKQEQASFNGRNDLIQQLINDTFIKQDKRVLLADGPKLLDVSSAPDIHNLPSPLDSQQVVSVALSPGADLLAAGFMPRLSNGTPFAVGKVNTFVNLWRVKTLELLKTFEGFSSVAYSQDGKILATASLFDKEVRLWDGKTLEPIGEPLPNSKGVVSVVFSRDGKIFAVAMKDGTIGLWDVATKRPLATLNGQRNITSLAFSQDGKRLASGNSDGSVKLWDTSQEMWSVSAQPGVGMLKLKTSIISLAFSPDGNILATGSGDGEVRFWRALTEAEVKSSLGFFQP